MVRHLVEWFPAFSKGGAGIEVPRGPSVDEDPTRAWLTQRDAVRALLEEMLPMDAALRASGHYGPRVPVTDDADVQTRLLAFIGRGP